MRWNDKEMSMCFHTHTHTHTAALELATTIHTASTPASFLSIYSDSRTISRRETHGLGPVIPGAFHAQRGRG